jgi:DNA polymerase V
MGVPYFQIKDSIKDSGVVVCSANLTLYRDLSRRVFEVMRQELDVVEQYSIDEAFFTLPSKASPLLLAEQLRTVVGNSLGLPVSIGIGQSKTQAKFANRCTKQSGVVAVWDTTQVPVALIDIPLHHIWGVGKGLSTQFRTAGLLTVADLLAVPADRLQARFGIVAVSLQAELAGVAVSPVRSRLVVPQKSIMSSRTFASATTEYAAVADALMYHINHVAADLRGLGCGAMYLKIWVRPSRFSDYASHGIRAERWFTAPVSATGSLAKVALALLKREFIPQIPYRKAGVLVAGLRAHDGQQSLFTPVSAESPLWSVVDRLNRTCGAGQIWLGTIPAQSRVKPRQHALTPAYTTQWSEIPVVSASLK